MGKKESSKPRARLTAYAFFVQTCREEHKRKHPGESVNFSEFSKKCGDKWKTMTADEKARFEDMSEKDKVRYEDEMTHYFPEEGAKKVKRAKATKKEKDPNAPKRALSGFFLFCAEERPKIKASNPDMSVSDVAKEMGRRWEVCTERPRFEELAAKEKERYNREMEAYKKSKGVTGVSPEKKAKIEVDEEEEEEEESDG